VESVEHGEHEGGDVKGVRAFCPFASGGHVPASRRVACDALACARPRFVPSVGVGRAVALCVLGDWRVVEVARPSFSVRLPHEFNGDEDGGD
jgi:hypothetical protein